ncbi:MAG: hypothetical protein A3C84_00450 [Candidatus Ryanbacteria bacterium RIFCSPHIGHO2_02_FULL_48_12]|uniref:DUF4190 domain-containing protein n=1 Tax=Candidatus Ryanbacteria bacterium RIFCSPHIGHO2_01_FULL_48_27 TaxID=1802115 RepID=A0A1G2FZY2_9BACT|nr:MAG: hypothetical protein A2756_04830 [Candidatus Ryanbacteria bacterium RIFCSPHIGHO2_01_FULL_48_27]OGZ50244.1 MAG: hypothetical protein A3C84_00450 [Candidatus Ryanbacteria bacterium RIFCSPHIGHO2_02_FULL_48_12]
MNIWKYAIVASGLLAPLAALAQGEFNDFIGRVTDGLNVIIVFLFLVATVMLLFGIVKYVAAGDDEDKVEEGRNLIIYGIIGLAVMVALWAFVNVAIDFFFAGRDFHIPDAGDGLPQQ